MTRSRRAHPFAGRLTAAVAVPLCLAAALSSAASPTAAREQRPLLHVVSMPDFLNADIADVSVSPLYQVGQPNSWNDNLAAGLDTVLDAVAAERPEKVLVAGDLVEGHWGVDVDNTGTFGPVETKEEKQAAITRAADLYYTAWQRRFSDRHLEVLPAVGDHEIGDNPWAGSADADFKRESFWTYKDAFIEKFTKPGGTFAFEDHPTSGQHTATAYAVQLAPEVLLVTVDAFKLTDSNVDVTVDGPQLAWLDGVLDRAQAQGIDWVMVQSHVPVLAPVRYRHSSNQKLAGRASSAFWKTLVEHKVDLLLTGEVHDTSMIHRDGVTQISHGGMFTWGESSYLTATFYPDRVELVAKDLNSQPVASPMRLWATSNKRSFDAVDYLGGTHEIGRLVLTPDQKVLEQSGKLFQYSLAAAMQGAPSARTLSGSTTWRATSDPSGAQFQLQLKVAAGSGAYSALQTTAWQPNGSLTRPLRDGDTACARAVARHPVNGLTSAPSSWRCVTAPYDDRVLVRRSGTTKLRALFPAYHSTTTELVDPGTRVRGPDVSTAIDRVSVRARTGPGAGRFTVLVGNRVLGRVDLAAPTNGFAWFQLPTNGRTGRVVLEKAGKGAVAVDAVELRHRP